MNQLWIWDISGGPDSKTTMSESVWFDWSRACSVTIQIPNIVQSDPGMSVPFCANRVGWFMAITVHRCTVRFIRQIINAAQWGGVTAGWNHSVWWLLFFHCWQLHTRASYLQLRLPLAPLGCCRVLKGIFGEWCNARWRHRQTDRRRGRQTDTERNAACSDKTGKEVWVGFLWQPHTSPRFAHMYTHTRTHQTS